MNEGKTGAPAAGPHAAAPVTVNLANRVWQGISGIESTAKGRLFVSWFTGGPKEPAPENTVLLCYSDDDGNTFSEPTAVGLPLSDGTRCFDPTLWIDPKGRLWYIFNRGNQDTAQHDVWARICDDPDAALPTFGDEFRIDLQVPYVFRMNKPTVLSSGEWIMPVTHAAEPIRGWFAGAKQLQGVAISRDEGRTWTLHGAVQAPHWALECMVTELADGRLWLLTRAGDGVLWESYSGDKGRTWSEGTASTIANPGSRFFIRRLASGAVNLKHIVNKLDKPSLVPAGWDPLQAGDRVLAGLKNICQSQVKGAHDSDFVMVDGKAYIIYMANDVQPGEAPHWPFVYNAMSIVDLATGQVDETITFAASEMKFENETLPEGACFVPRILRKDAATLRCFFASENPGQRQAQTWYRDFDLGTGRFAPGIFRAEIETDEGVFPMQPQYLHRDAAARGFQRPALDFGLYPIDGFKRIDGRIYAVLNNFPGKQNAWSVLSDSLDRFTVLGHYFEPQSAQLSESAVNRLPDGSWLAISRQDDRDSRKWERKYRFETSSSFQYPTLREFDGAIYLSVTQGDHSDSRKERIMFGKLED